MDLWTVGCADSRLCAARNPMDGPWKTPCVSHRPTTGRRLPTSSTGQNNQVLICAMTKIGLWLRLSVPATLAYCHRVQRRLTPPAFGQGCADNSQNTPNFPSHETLFGQPLTRQISSVGFDLKIPKSVVAACGACGQPPACGRAVGNARRFPRAVHRIARSAKAGIGAADCPQIHRPNLFEFAAKAKFVGSTRGDWAKCVR